MVVEIGFGTLKFPRARTIKVPKQPLVVEHEKGGRDQKMVLVFGHATDPLGHVFQKTRLKPKSGSENAVGREKRHFGPRKFG